MVKRNEELLEQLAGRLADGEALGWDELAVDPRLSPGELRALHLLAKVGSVPQSASPGLASPAPRLARSVLPSPSGSLPPLLIGGYEVFEEIGHGSFGVVYRARDRALQRDVALKVLKPDPLAKEEPALGAEARARFVREARVLASLDHPNIVRIHAVEQEGTELRLCLELLQGDTLQELVRTQGPFSAAEATAIGIDLCRALAAVHAKGLIHRDVKPANVMRATGGRIVLLDFGVTEAPRTRGAAGLRVGGTPLHMPPEQVLRGKEATPASDLYALGVTLYHLVSGRYPYQPEAGATLWERMESPAGPTPLRTWRPDLPTRLVDLIDRAVAKAPADRFATAGEFERALVAGEAQAAAQVARVVEQAKTRRAAVKWVVAAIVLAAAAVAVSRAWSSGDGSGTSQLPFLPECTFVVKDAVGREWREVGRFGATEVWTKDEVAFELRCDEPLHVYAFQQDLTGACWKHQPLAVGGATNPIPAVTDDRPFMFPDGTRGYQMACVRDGADALLVVVSRGAAAAAEQFAAGAGFEPPAVGKGDRPGPPIVVRGAGRAPPTIDPPRHQHTLADFPRLEDLARRIDAARAADPALGLKYWVLFLEHAER